MTTDLLYLAWSALLTVVLWAPTTMARLQRWGLTRAVGYPKDPPELPDWAKRAERAHMNAVENIGAFAALVLVAHVAGEANTLTAAGAAMFFWARLVQTAALIFAVPWVRSLAYFIGWLGMVIIFVQIVL